MDVEHQILIEAMKQAFHAAHGRQPSDWAPSGSVDYERLLKLAQRHRLVPFLPFYFQGRDWNVPESFCEQVDQAVNVHVARNTFMTDFLMTLLGRLAKEGVRAVPLRGPLLAARLFGDPVYRQCDDLDLLLESDSLQRVKHMLLAEGFTLHHHMTPVVESLSVQAGWEIILKSPDDRFTVELHSQITPCSYGVRIPLRTWWEHVEAWEWNGQPTLTFEPPWLYLANMIHAAKHLWSRLGWLVDLYALEQLGGYVMVDQVASEAARFGLHNMVRTGRCFIQGTMTSGTGPMKSVHDHESKLGCRLEQLLVSGDRPSTNRRLRLQAELRDGGCAKLRYLMAEVAEPSYADWISCPALHRVPWLYYLWRPLRLLSATVPRRRR